jgi:hypothetical protein
LHQFQRFAAFVGSEANALCSLSIGTRRVKILSETMKNSAKKMSVQLHVDTKTEFKL